MINETPNTYHWRESYFYRYMNRPWALINSSKTMTFRRYERLESSLGLFPNHYINVIEDHIRYLPMTPCMGRK